MGHMGQWTMVNGTMVYTGDADLVGDNIDTIEKNT
jgi:hypothetical protein